MTVLIDTSFFLAAMYTNDANHMKALSAQRSLFGEERIVPSPVVYELFYMTTNHFTMIAQSGNLRGFNPLSSELKSLQLWICSVWSRLCASTNLLNSTMPMLLLWRSQNVSILLRFIRLTAVTSLSSAPNIAIFWSYCLHE